MYSSLSENFPPFSSNLKLSSTILFSLEQSKICLLAKGYSKIFKSRKGDNFVEYCVTCPCGIHVGPTFDISHLVKFEVNIVKCQSVARKTQYMYKARVKPGNIYSAIV